MNPDATGPSSTPVELRGVGFSLTDRGGGPVVLDAHGLGSSRASNRRTVLADFSPVASAGRRLISYDARGHGASTGTDRPEDYTWDSLALDLLALADHFSPEAPVSGIGSSMGTGTLLHAAVARPERFDRLVLAAPPTAWETRAEQVGIYASMADMVEGSGPSMLARLMAQAPVPPIFADVPGYPPLPDIQPELLPTVYRGAGLTDLPPLDALAALEQPTLILAWAGDPGHPVSTAQRLAGTLPHAELRIAETHAEILAWGEAAARFLQP